MAVKTNSAPKNKLLLEFLRNRGIVVFAMVLGFVAVLLHATVMPGMEIVAFLSFLGPLGLGAYGIKTYRSIKEDALPPEEDPGPRGDPLS
jgi:hypothetical protein